VLFNVVGGSSLTLFEVNEAAAVIKDAVDSEANIIFGVAQDPAMENDVRITLIATGFASKMQMSEGSQQDEVTQFLKSLKSEEELDVPSFLRRPLFSHRRQAIARETKLVNPQQTPSQNPLR